MWREGVGIEVLVELGVGARVFFFQAEDGIRDYDVTGVQTCALPIYSHIPNGNNFRDVVGRRYSLEIGYSF